MAISSTTSASGAAFNIDGIASGLTTGSIIDKLMTLEQAPLNSLTRKQTSIKARDTAYADLRGQVVKFQLAMKNLLLAANVNPKTTTTDKVGVLSVTAGSTAMNGSFMVAIDHLATASALTTTGSLSVGV